MSYWFRASGLSAAAAAGAAALLSRSARRAAPASMAPMVLRASLVQRPTFRVARGDGSGDKVRTAYIGRRKNGAGRESEGREKERAEKREKRGSQCQPMLLTSNKTKLPQRSSSSSSSVDATSSSSDDKENGGSGDAPPSSPAAPFHLAMPVANISAARECYGG